MNQKTKEFREQISKLFIRSLEEQDGVWKKNWLGRGNGTPVNAATGRKYRGTNRFYLRLAGAVMGSDDPRWATYKQVQDKGWRVNKGAKGVKVEFWKPYNFKEKQDLTWDEYYALKEKAEIGLIAKYYTVFNGKDITGIPELQRYENKEVVSDQLIRKISEGMGIEIKNDGGDKAYYSLRTDSIHLPEKESFFSSYDYNSTALHELSHASGAPGRLGRKMGGNFGSQEYAYEELVAEISSCFMGEHLDIQVTDQHMENHKAYVQGWIKGIQKDPDSLIHAIRDAGKAADYLEYHAGLISQKEYQKLQNEMEESPVETAEKESPELLIEKDFAQKGFKATPKLLDNIQKLNHVTKSNHSLQSIHQAYKSGLYKGSSETQKILSAIVKDLQKQEIAMRGVHIPIK